MNSSDRPLNDPEMRIEELTVSEYAKKFDMPENTVRTKINRKKLRTTWGIRDGKKTLLILVDSSLVPGLNDPNDDDELQGTFHEQFNEHSLNNSLGSVELLNFMDRTFQTVQSYSSQIIELSRENERYKLISENSSRTLGKIEHSHEQLQSQIFEKDAKIRELELKGSEELSLKAKINALEEKISALDVQRLSLTDKYAELESENTMLKGDLENTKSLLAAKDTEIASLQNQLTTERNKSALDKLFKR